MKRPLGQVERAERLSAVNIQRETKKEWQMEREAEDVESACNINKNKVLWEVCVIATKTCPGGFVSLSRYAC